MHAANFFQMKYQNLEMWQWPWDIYSLEFLNGSVAIYNPMFRCFNVWTQRVSRSMFLLQNFTYPCMVKVYAVHVKFLGVLKVICICFSWCLASVSKKYWYVKNFFTLFQFVWHTCMQSMCVEQHAAQQQLADSLEVASLRALCVNTILMHQCNKLVKNTTK